MVRDNIQFPQRSKQFGSEPPPGAEMDVSWTKALGPQKSVPGENLSLLCVAGWEVVKGEKTAA